MKLFESQPDEDWWSNGRDGKNNRCSPLSQIDGSNFSELELKWQWELPTQDVPIWSSPNKQFGPNEGTPLKVGDFLFTVTAASQVAKFDLNTGLPALDSTGSPIIYEPEIYRRHSISMIGFLHRGAAYWEDENGNHGRIFLASGDGVLVALDTDQLQPIASFGNGGSINLPGRESNRSNPKKPLRFGNTSPPIVCRHRVIVGSSMPDLDDGVSPPIGYVNAFDARSGRKLWRFDPIPSNEAMRRRGIDPEQQWANQSNKDAGHTNVWSHLSADEHLDRVYLPVSSAFNDAYGGERPGDNLYSQSLVALEAKNGEVAWHQQLVHHGVWDYDPPAAPNLIDVVEEDGTTAQLVVQVTKQAFSYVFDRVSGQPRWDLIEAPVPESSVVGERLSKTQPIPVKPMPFDQQGVYPADGYDLLQRPVAANILNLTPGLRARTMSVLQKYIFGPLFTPPSEKNKETIGTIQVPGFLGGASWSGAVADESTGSMYVSSVTKENGNEVAEVNGKKFSAGPSSWGICDEQGGRYNLPILNPPYGRVTAINLVAGDHKWQKPRPVGRGPRAKLEQAAGASFPPGDLGWSRRTHLLVTPELLLGAQEAGRVPIGFTDEDKHTLLWSFVPEPPEERTLNVYSPATGEVLGKVPLPAHAQGALMSFGHNGNQYIGIPTGGFNLPHRILIYGLRGEK